MDAPTPRLAWFAVAAVQALNVGILLKDQRHPRRAGRHIGKMYDGGHAV